MFVIQLLAIIMKTIYSIAIYLLIGTTFSYACSCYDVSVRKALRQSEVAFVGKVIKVTKNDFVKPTKDHNGKVYNFEYSLYDFEFEITEIFKGKVETKTVRITTTGTGDDCGGYYLENETYLIYAYTTVTNPYFGERTKMEPYLTTDICIGSELVSELEPIRLKKLKRYKKRNK